METPWARINSRLTELLRGPPGQPSGPLSPSISQSPPWVSSPHLSPLTILYCFYPISKGLLPPFTPPTPIHPSLITSSFSPQQLPAMIDFDSLPLFLQDRARFSVLIHFHLLLGVGKFMVYRADRPTDGQTIMYWGAIFCENARMIRCNETDQI